MKRRKNISTDVFGTELGRVHVGRQNIGSLQMKKMKALKKPKKFKSREAKSQVSAEHQKESSVHNSVTAE